LKPVILSDTVGSLLPHSGGECGCLCNFAWLLYDIWCRRHRLQHVVILMWSQF